MEEKEKYILKNIFAYLRNKKSKVKAIGSTLDILTLFVAISKSLAERISSLQTGFSPYYSSFTEKPVTRKIFVH